MTAGHLQLHCPSWEKGCTAEVLSSVTTTASGNSSNLIKVLGLRICVIDCSEGLVGSSVMYCVPNSSFSFVLASSCPSEIRRSHLFSLSFVAI